MKKSLLFLGLTLVLGTGLEAQSLSDSLVVHFRFSGNANDISGQGNNGTVSGATLTSGINGSANSAYFFDGINDYISFPSTDLFNSEYTYSLWMKYNETLPDNYKAVLLGVGGSDCDQSINLTKNYFGYNGLNAGGYYQVGNTFNTNSPTIPAEQGWVHIVGVKSQDSMKLFIDGIKIASVATPSQNPCYSGMNPKGILGSGVGINQYFKGQIDEVRIYKRPLADAEVASLHSVELTSLTKEPVAVNYLLYPNPSETNSIYLKTDAVVQSVSVYDIQGRVMDIQFETESGSIQMGDAAKGTYFLEVLTDKGVIHERMVFN